jgi:hypothetical protein
MRRRRACVDRGRSHMDRRLEGARLARRRLEAASRWLARWRSERTSRRLARWRSERTSRRLARWRSERTSRKFTDRWSEASSARLAHRSPDRSRWRFAGGRSERASRRIADRRPERSTIAHLPAEASRSRRERTACGEPATHQRTARHDGSRAQRRRVHPARHAQPFGGVAVEMRSNMRPPEIGAGRKSPVRRVKLRRPVIADHRSDAAPVVVHVSSMIDDLRAHGPPPDDTTAVAPVDPRRAPPVAGNPCPVVVEPCPPAVVER